MSITKCRIKDCGKPINTDTDKYLCGYDKCQTCCLGCMHRSHLNPNYKASPVPAVNASMSTLDKFFGKL